MRPCGTFDENYGQDMAVCRTRFQWVMLILVIILMFSVYPLVASRYWLSVANILAIFIIAALGLQIILGYCGQISLGHMAFVAAGAYTTAILMNQLGWGWIATVPAAAAGAALLGLLFGLPAFRIKGFYIALTTMAAHFIVIWLIFHGGELTGAHFGITFPPPRFGNIVIDSERSFLYLNMTFLVLMTFIAKNLVRMKLGRAFIAIRDDDIAAEFMGINVLRYKLLAFTIGSAFAGVAGALYGAYNAHVTPDNFPFIESIWFIGYIVVGGMGSITGAFFGVIFLILLKQMVMLAAPILIALIPGLGMGLLAALLKIAFGIIIALFLIFEPRGLYHRWEIIKSSVRLWPFPY